MKWLPCLALIMGLGPLLAQQVKIVEIREDGLVADYYVPEGASARPGIIVLGGSSGGIAWQKSQAESFAKSGFAALAVAYFGMEGLPPDLEEIPLEYFQKAFDWLAEQDGADEKRIGLCGVSKGGELVLLLGANMPQIRAVAALVPSSHVFQSVADGWPVSSSWKKDGKPLPFIPYLVTQNFDRHNLSVMYRESLGQERFLADATIPVEKIQGPILLISGDADKIWPSKEMSEMVLARLKRNAFPHKYDHISYANAGHSIASIGADPELRNGGTVKANLEAQKDVQRRLMAFFEENL